MLSRLQSDQTVAAQSVAENDDGRLFPGAAARVKVSSRRESYGMRIGTMIWNWVRTNVW